MEIVFIPAPATIFFWKTYKTPDNFLSLISSRFIHIVAWVRISSSLRQNNPLHRVSRPHWFIPSFFDWHSGRVHLLWIMLLWTRVYKYPFKSLLLLLLSVYPRVKSLDYVVTLCLILEDPPIVFSTMTALFPILLVLQASNFPHLLQHMLFSVGVSLK